MTLSLFTTSFSLMIALLVFHLFVFDFTVHAASKKATSNQFRNLFRPLSTPLVLCWLSILSCLYFPLSALACQQFLHDNLATHSQKQTATLIWCIYDTGSVAIGHRFHLNLPRTQHSTMNERNKILSLLQPAEVP
jgi:hypothetical protein